MLAFKYEINFVNLEYKKNFGELHSAASINMLQKNKNPFQTELEVRLFLLDILTFLVRIHKRQLIKNFISVKTHVNR